ncbi:MAG: transposase family protein, partial [Methylococcales bacterium]|nr:transposase family protein [Methylococcales bacterium]
MLRTKVPGVFYYLYLALDVWSRKIVASVVHERESSELSTVWLTGALSKEKVSASSLIIHQDNGAPMKGTLKACMEGLGVHMSYSRPYVSDDNPYSESLFGTMKTRPAYPREGFVDLEAAQLWCEGFVLWYNTKHLHSAIAYVTPVERHQRLSGSIWTQRRAVYQE